MYIAATLTFAFHVSQASAAAQTVLDVVTHIARRIELALGSVQNNMCKDMGCCDETCRLSSCTSWANLTLILGLAFCGTLPGSGLETTKAGRFAGLVRVSCAWAL